MLKIRSRDQKFKIAFSVWRASLMTTSLTVDRDAAVASFNSTSASPGTSILENACGRGGMSRPDYLLEDAW